MKWLGFSVVLLVTLLPLYADAESVIITNSESWWLYFSLDPELSADFSSAADSFSTLNRLKFSPLAPGASIRIENLGAGSHRLIGFWSAQGVSNYSVWNLSFSLQAGQVKNFDLTKSGSAMNLVSTAERIKPLPTTPIVIDNDYSDWAAYPAIAVFPKAFAPERFAYQSKQARIDQPINSSNFWGKGGTQLDKVKAVFTPQTLSLYFSSTTPFSPGLSIFLYLFSDRNTKELNAYTVELQINDNSGSGKILLWQRGKNGSQEIGVFKTAAFYLEGTIELEKLPEMLALGLYNNYSFDLKTSYFDNIRGFHEEFFFTSIYCNEVYFLK